MEAITFPFQRAHTLSNDLLVFIFGIDFRLPDSENFKTINQYHQTFIFFSKRNLKRISKSHVLVELTFLTHYLVFDDVKS